MTAASEHVIDSGAVPPTTDAGADAVVAAPPAQDAATVGPDAAAMAPTDAAAPVDTSIAAQDAGPDSAPLDATTGGSTFPCLTDGARFEGSFSGTVSESGTSNPFAGTLSFDLNRFEPTYVEIAGSFWVNTINPRYVSSTLAGRVLDTSPWSTGETKITGTYQATSGSKYPVTGELVGACVSESEAAGTWAFRSDAALGVTASGTWTASL